MDTEYPEYEDASVVRIVPPKSTFVCGYHFAQNPCVARRINKSDHVQWVIKFRNGTVEKFIVKGGNHEQENSRTQIM